ncbi:LytTr DNA-binding domain-containing protein [Gemmobacter megaterium]|uniref:LytTr DNA-binding domain-containing protein n=2 Tax=Gemmobacter megaterium TaxID=1086013 RepID=A0A1N7LS20_9RHOB|nr:LytTr DNA-binding domain-containing protein [Gemmobacter megaterium]
METGLDTTRNTDKQAATVSGAAFDSIRSAGPAEMHRMHISYVNGSRVQFTLHELLGFHRERHSATLFLATWLGLIFLGPFPAMAALPLANQVVFWGLVFPGTFAVYMITLIAMGRHLRLARSWIAHVVGATACGLISPEIGTWVGLVHTGSMSHLRLIIGAFSLVCSMASEFLMVTYLMPRYVARLRRAAPEPAPATAPPQAATPPAPLPTTSPADTTARPAQPAMVVLLGRPFALADLLLISSEEHYVQVQTIDGRHMLRGRISDIEAQLPDTLGLRVHRSHWVAAAAVAGLTRTREGWTLDLTDGTQVPVARARRDAVRQWMEAMGKAA